MKHLLKLHVQIYFFAMLMIWPVPVHAAARPGGAYTGSEETKTHKALEEPKQQSRTLEKLEQQKSMLLKNVTNDIDYWLATLGERAPTEDEIASQIQQRIKELHKEIVTLEAAYREFINAHPGAPEHPLLSPNEHALLDASLREYVSNAQPIKNFRQKIEQFATDNKKEIDAWRATFGIQLPTSDEITKKKSEIIKTFNDKLATLQSNAEFFALEKRAPTMLALLQQEITKSREDVTRYIQEPHQDIVTLPDDLCPLISPMLGVSDEGAVAPWLITLFGWHQIFATPPGTAQWMPALSTDTSTLATVSDDGIVRIFARTKTATYKEIFKSSTPISFHTPILSGDGSTFATTARDRTVRLFKRTKDTTYVQAPTPAADQSYVQPALSADGSFYAITKPNGALKIMKQDRDGTYKKFFLSAPGRGHHSPILSADGSTCIVVSPHGISTLFVLTRNTYTRHALTNNTLPTLKPDNSNKRFVYTKGNTFTQMFKKSVGTSYILPKDITNGLPFAALSSDRTAVIFAPIFDTSMYKSLTTEQLEFLHNLSVVRTMLSPSTVIRFNALQSALWHSLPPELRKQISSTFKIDAQS